MYSDEKLEELYALSRDYYVQCVDLQDELIRLSEHMTRGAKEHALYGIARRLKTLRECMRYFFDQLPPDQDSEPEMEVKAQADANLHAFLINSCGIGDNIAWLIAYEYDLGNEQDLENRRHDIGLFRKEVSQHLPERVSEKAEQFSKWYKFIVDQRHPTAHRIPPYIIPYIQSAETGENDYTPYYIHAFDKSRPVPLHAQVLCDMGAVVELVDALIQDLKVKNA
jgi:hypothetical protein